MTDLNRLLTNVLFTACIWQVLLSAGFAQGVIPQNFDQLWGNYDPRAEPLNVEVLREWEENGVTMQVLRYRVGNFKGEVAKIAAVWGYPSGRTGLPGLVQIHGGGQFADANAVLTNARRGYATISLGWAGRINAPEYRVTAEEVKLFWQDKTKDPKYKVTTDWGAVDGYHAPTRFKGSSFPSAKPYPWTIDQVPSPRNSGWFLCATAARRAITFLEQQPQVDANRIGVYGHSMGGKLAVMTATDSRVKAAAPSCGGISDRNNDHEIFENTLCDDVYLPHIKCPIIFLSPANDFHGRIDDLQRAVKEIQSQQWRITCAPHHNHQDTSPYEVATQIWFDKILKGSREVPKTPTLELRFDEANGQATVTVVPDSSQPIQSVDVYYTRHGQMADAPNDRDNTVSRFWYHQSLQRHDDSWKSDLEIKGDERPLWVYANVTYGLDTPVIGAGYYYRTYNAEKYVLSTLMKMMTPDQLKQAGVPSADGRQSLIEDFQSDWKHHWFTYRETQWPLRTHKVYEPKWTAPSDDAILQIDVQSDDANPFVVGVDGFAAVVQLEGGAAFQTIELSRRDFQSPKGKAMESWSGIRELRLGHSDRIGSKKDKKDFGGTWKGDAPQFKNLKWK